MMDAELPDTADVFIPGGIVSDPPCLAQTWDNLYAKTLKSIRNPIGMPPLASFGGEDKTVVIVIPDILALPKTFTTAAVHLCMKDPSQNSTARDNAAANQPLWLLRRGKRGNTMLELDYLDVKGCITPKEISALVQQSTILLQAAKQGEVCFADSLGWLSSEEWANDAFLTTLEKVAAKVRAEADAFVLIGVGGSNNAARAVIEALQKENVPEIIYMGNTLSPFALQKQLQKLEGKSFYIDCIAKNFETLEPGASFRALRAILQKQYGERAHTRIIATGTRGSSLEVLCAEHGYTFFEFPTNIGGRYTAISNVGLLPMAVAGIDVRAVVDGAKKMEQRLKAEPAACNLALRYACIRNLLYRKGYRLEMLSCFEPAYHWFFKWWIQLFAESEGKDGKGLFPVASEYSEELHSVGQYVQDGEPLMFETFLNVQQQNGSLMLYADAVKDAFDYLDEKDFWEINKASFVATRRAHSEKLPCLTLNIDCMDAASFGELFYFFQFACYLSARILGVNPFNQPGVEAYKGWMFNELGKS